MWTTAAMVAAKAAATGARADITDGVSVTLAALQLFSAGLMAVWTYRVCRSAIAAVSCFVPFVQAIVPFHFVRRAVRPLVGRTAAITRWQLTTIAAFAVSRLGTRSSVTIRVGCLAAGAILLAVAAVHAHRAIRLVDRGQMRL